MNGLAIRKSEVLSACSALLPEYASLSSSCTPYERKGIFHSEMLLVLASIEALGIEHVIESGRARGQSTELIARFCGEREIPFDSVELLRSTDDAEVAEERLKGLSSSVNLHYGDAFELLPPLIGRRPTLVLIDGPKGPRQEVLCIECLRHESVKGVLLHDTRSDKDIRGRLERFFPEAGYYTDDYEYANRFRDLDRDCWLKYVEDNPGAPVLEPYRHLGERMRSYGPTLALIVAEELLPGTLDEYEAELNRLRRERATFLRRVYFLGKRIARRLGISS